MIFAMMKEVLSRRFEKITPENRPDVILLDGGIGQLHAVHECLQNYDLSDLNIIGVSDRKYTLEEEGSSSFGYKVIPIDKIVQYKPDVVLIATLKFLSIMDDLKRNTLKGLEVFVLPLVDRPFFTLLKEIFQ